MTIQGDLKTLASLNTEIKTLAVRLKTLRTQKTSVELSIANYLKSINSDDVEYQDNVIALKDCSQSQVKPVEKKRQDVKGILVELGVADVETALSRIEGAQRNYKSVGKKVKVIAKK